MNTHYDAKLYQPPIIKVVAFRVEQGFYGSSPQPGLELPLTGYGNAANSGSGFWGGNSSGGASNGGYGSQGFSWGGGSTDGNGSVGGYSDYGWSW